jgi:hypothetical protein
MLEPINQRAKKFVEEKMKEHNQLMTPIEQEDCIVITPKQK